MRRRLAISALAITSLVAAAFVVPLAVLVRRIAADRALTAAEIEARTLVATLAVTERPADVEVVVASAGDPGNREVSVFLADGTVLGEPAEPDAAVALARTNRAFTTSADGGRQVLVPIVVPDGSTTVVRVFVPNSALTRGVLGSWLSLGVLGVVLVGIGVFVADRLGRSVVRPIDALADVARRLAAGELEARAADSGPDEVAEVARAVNLLASRIDDLLLAEREAVADLSHRLRTPLAAVRLEVESLAGRDGAKTTASDLDDLVTATDELARAVDRLIHEARRPLREGVGAAADLAGIVRERTEFWAALAEEEERTWSVNVPDHRLAVRAHPDDLVAAVDALLGNVLAHTPASTPFEVDVEAAGPGAVRLVVSDRGPGIAHPGVVERGISTAGSTGLGLDIVRRTAEASGGRLLLEDRPGGGARIEVVLGRA